MEKVGEPVLDKAQKQVTITTGSNGNATLCGHKANDGWSFIEGEKYCLIEITPPAGFALDATPIDFIITEVPGNDIEYVTGDTIQIANAKESFCIIKKDKNTQNALAGAEFELTGKIAGKDQTITVTSGADGVAGFSKLEPGRYTLKETKAPNGYKANGKVYTIVIDENLNVSSNDLMFSDNEGVISAIVYNEKGSASFELIKTNEKNQPLAKGII